MKPTPKRSPERNKLIAKLAVMFALKQKFEEEMKSKEKSNPAPKNQIPLKKISEN